MRKTFFLSIILLFGCLGAQTIFAQDTATNAIDSTKMSIDDSLSLGSFKDSIDKALGVHKSYFQASLSYLSNNVYLGRKDTAITPYISPALGYYNKSGFHVDASASYLAYPGENRIDLVTAEAGYTFSAGNFQGLVNAAKYWYSSKSYNIRSEIKGSLSFSAAYDFGFIKPSLTPNLNFGDNTDLALTFGLEHSFYFDKDAFDITPTINANGSTQNYYSSYYKKRKFSVKRKGVNVIVNGSQSGEVIDAGQFKMLDYEFILPINYSTKKLTLDFTPYYAIPINPAITQVTTIKGTSPAKITTKPEILTNSFYFLASIMYKF